MTEYKIVLSSFDAGEGATSFIAEVNELISQGWSPLGGVAMSTETEYTKEVSYGKRNYDNSLVLAQAMIKTHSIPNPASCDTP